MRCIFVDRSSRPHMRAAAGVRCSITASNPLSLEYLEYNLVTIISYQNTSLCITITPLISKYQYTSS